MVASLGVDQGPCPLPEAKALGPEVFSVASCREETQVRMLLRPQATPPGSPLTMQHPKRLARPLEQSGPRDPSHRSTLSPTGRKLLLALPLR